MRETTCCFTGHRIIGSDLSIDVLRRGIRYMINEHKVDTFIVGGATGFDTLCAKEVLALKSEFPHIKLHIYAPCNNQSERWSFFDKMTYNRILKKADLVDMPNKPYYDGCMKERNYKMVNNSAFCIGYLNNSKSGTAQTYRYAVNQGLTAYNIAGKK